LDNCLDVEIELVGHQGYGFSGVPYPAWKPIKMGRFLVTLLEPQLPPAWTTCQFNSQKPWQRFLTLNAQQK